MITSLLESAVVMCLCGLIAWAGLRDLVSMTISNRLVLLVAGLFALAVLLGVVPRAEVGSHVLIGIIALSVGFLLFAGGVIGGGDAKLAAATALWLGPVMTLSYIFYTALFGAVLAAGMIVFRRFPLPPGLQTVGWINRLHMPAAEIPYGVAMAGATMVAIAQIYLLPTL